MATKMLGPDIFSRLSRLWRCGELMGFWKRLSRYCYQTKVGSPRRVKIRFSTTSSCHTMSSLFAANRSPGGVISKVVAVPAHGEAGSFDFRWGTNIQRARWVLACAAHLASLSSSVWVLLLFWGSGLVKDGWWLHLWYLWGRNTTISQVALFYFWKVIQIDF